MGSNGSGRYTLWGRPGWGSALVEAQLDWYGLPFAYETVGDLFKDPDAKARLQKVNPLAQVPTLVMPDGSVMSESAAITLLLADVTGLPRKALYEQALAYRTATDAHDADD
mgnify:CR=1 FL=1